MPQARRKTAKTHGGKEMQRKFLEDLGLEKEVIDKIMTENSNDINNVKKKSETERDNYKEQLETAQTALKEFEGIDVKSVTAAHTQSEAAKSNSLLTTSPQRIRNIRQK